MCDDKTYSIRSLKGNNYGYGWLFWLMYQSYKSNAQKHQNNYLIQYQ